MNFELLNGIVVGFRSDDLKVAISKYVYNFFELDCSLWFILCSPNLKLLSNRIRFILHNYALGNNLQVETNKWTSRSVWRKSKWTCSHKSCPYPNIWTCCFVYLKMPCIHVVVISVAVCKNIHKNQNEKLKKL